VCSHSGQIHEMKAIVARLASAGPRPSGAPAMAPDVIRRAERQQWPHKSGNRVI
jgi:hypothetical protein